MDKEFDALNEKNAFLQKKLEIFTEIKEANKKYEQDTRNLVTENNAFQVEVLSSQEQINDLQTSFEELVIENANLKQEDKEGVHFFKILKV